ncbi:hypothetical protein EC988_005001, partial [Linderina pennispora]
MALSGSSAAGTSQSDSGDSILKRTPGFAGDRKSGRTMAWKQMASTDSGQQRWQMALYENRTLASAITAAVTGILAGYP